MRIAAILLLVSLVSACGGGVGADPTVGSDGSDVSVPTTTVATSVPAETPTTPASGSVDRDRANANSEPDYDVFLAAVAETLVGTRFEEAPFEDPELFAATGLLLCERMESGAVGDEVVFEYLTGLTGGDAATADDDQLVLAGALMGAAEAALCPETGTR